MEASAVINRFDRKTSRDGLGKEGAIVFITGSTFKKKNSFLGMSDLWGILLTCTIGYITPLLLFTIS